MSLSPALRTLTVELCDVVLTPPLSFVLTAEQTGGTPPGDGRTLGQRYGPYVQRCYGTGLAGFVLPFILPYVPASARPYVSGHVLTVLAWPFEVVAVRMEGEHELGRSGAEIREEIIATRGYSGLLAGLGVAFVNVASRQGLKAAVERVAAPRMGSWSSWGTLLALATGALLTVPLELVARRMIMAKGDKSAAQVAREVLDESGAAGLFAGSTTRMALFAVRPLSAMLFVWGEQLGRHVGGSVRSRSG